MGQTESEVSIVLISALSVLERADSEKLPLLYPTTWSNGLMSTLFREAVVSYGDGVSRQRKHRFCLAKGAEEATGSADSSSSPHILAINAAGED